jgi:hypothetical protein
MRALKIKNTVLRRRKKKGRVRTRVNSYYDIGVKGFSGFNIYLGLGPQVVGNRSPYTNWLTDLSTQRVLRD